MSNLLTIQSYKGPYSVVFGSPFASLEKGLKENEHLIIDSKVAELYGQALRPALNGTSVLFIDAAEQNKSLEKIPEYITFLSDHGVRRGHLLIAVGGGIIQDIVSFIAAILFRGLSWKFYPTTLLAQADSCIGSKSSINVDRYKNQVGTFTPPRSIHVATEVLETLSDVDFRSGLGEIIKAHLIGGWDDFRSLAVDYDLLKKNKSRLLQAIRRSLEIKQALIEKDEFDQNERLILNYGHSFGHAIESATHYQIPHGIAITMGIAMANWFSREFSFMKEEVCTEIQSLLKRNYQGFETTPIPFDAFFTALSKDKKNSQKEVALILSRCPGKVFRDRYSNDRHFQILCKNCLPSF